MRYQSYQVRPQTACPVLSCLSCSHRCQLIAAQLTSLDTEQTAGHVAFLPSQQLLLTACVLARCRWCRAFRAGPQPKPTKPSGAYAQQHLHGPTPNLQTKPVPTCRLLHLQSAADLAADLSRKVPTKIDIGPVYTHDPRQRAKYAKGEEAAAGAACVWSGELVTS